MIQQLYNYYKQPKMILNAFISQHLTLYFLVNLQLQ